MPATRGGSKGVELSNVQAANRITIRDVQVGLDEERTVARLVQVLEDKGVIGTAARGGLETQAIIKLAQRLKPDELLNFDQAIIEVESAVTIALDVIARGERGTNLDAFVNSVLERVAEKTKGGDFDSAVHTVDDALAELDRREAEQREAARRSRVALLEEGVNADTLRRDAVSVARRIEILVAIDHPTERPAWLPEFRNDTTPSTRTAKQAG
jgi:hypothetical protein